jgi:hypothetical protein
MYVFWTESVQKPSIPAMWAAPLKQLSYSFKGAAHIAGIDGF